MVKVLHQGNDQPAAKKLIHGQAAKGKPSKKSITQMLARSAPSLTSASLCQAGSTCNDPWAIQSNHMVAAAS